MFEGGTSLETCDLEIAVFTTPPSFFFHCVQTNFHVALFDFQVTFLAITVLWCGDLDFFFLFLIFFSKWDKLPPLFLPSPSPFFECLFGEGSCQYSRVQNYPTKCYAQTPAPRVRNVTAHDVSNAESGVARCSSWSALNCDDRWLLQGVPWFYLRYKNYRLHRSCDRRPRARALSPWLGSFSWAVDGPFGPCSCCPPAVCVSPAKSLWKIAWPHVATSWFFIY